MIITTINKPKIRCFGGYFLSCRAKHNFCRGTPGIVAQWRFASAKLHGDFTVLSQMSLLALNQAFVLFWNTKSELAGLFAHGFFNAEHQAGKLWIPLLKWYESTRKSNPCIRSKVSLQLHSSEKSNSTNRTYQLNRVLRTQNRHSKLRSHVRSLNKLLELQAFMIRESLVS